MEKAPRVIAGAIVRKDGKLLLIKEVLESGEEKWIFPGGGVEFGESIEDAAVRELKEETGLDARIKEFLGFKEVIRPQFDYHTVVFFFLAEPLSNDIKTIEKVLDAKYFTPDEAKELPLVDSAKWAIEEMKSRGMLN